MLIGLGVNKYNLLNIKSNLVCKALVKEKFAIRTAFDTRNTELNITENVWFRSCQIINMTTIENKLRNFQYKFLSNIYTTVFRVKQLNNRMQSMNDL